MVIGIIFGSFLLGHVNSQIGQINRQSEKIGIAPVEPALMVLDEYVFTDGSSSRTYSLHTFSSFGDPKSTREASYGLQALAADRKGRVYGVNWVGDSRDPYLYVPSFHAVEDGPKWTGPLKRPMGVACDRAGKIFVVDATLCQVIRVDDHLGNGMVRFGSPGSGIGQFKNPSGIAIGPTGQIYVADNGNQRIVRIDDLDGNGWTAFNGSQFGREGKQVTSVRDIAIDSKNRLYYCRNDNGYIVRVDDMKGSKMAWFGGPSIGGSKISLNPSGIAIDSYDHIFFSDQGIREIVRIDDFDKKDYRYLHPAENRPFRPSRLAAFVPVRAKIIR
jgi:sugar lactone lactonase YvrE